MKLSRSKIELFLDCPRCFFLDVVRRVHRPPGFPFTLNNAVDLLLKREFDAYRSLKQPHPLQVQNGIDLFPSEDVRLDQWRNALAGGIDYVHPTHSCTYFGAIDDLWVNPMGQVAVVDYKATAADTPVSQLPVWAVGYRRQLSFYSWLLRKNGADVLDTAYLVYATASTQRYRFDGRLDFDLRLVPLTTDESWIEPTLESIQEILKLSSPPSSSSHCKYCRFTVGSLS